MSISDRYRETVKEVNYFLTKLKAAADGEETREWRVVTRAAEGLAELVEQVGEIPRIRLEAQLTPVLLRAHKQLDQARLLFEEAGEEDQAAGAWELEQKIYRLLNDL